MNGLTPPKSGAAEWPPGPTPLAPRGAPDPSDNFAGILDSHQARTATAEGQDRSPRTEGRNRRDDDGPVANDRAEARSNARWARERREADGVERDRPVQHHEDDAQAKPADSDAKPAAPAADAAAAAAAAAAKPAAGDKPATPVTPPAAVQPDVAKATQTQTQGDAKAQAQSAQVAVPAAPAASTASAAAAASAKGQPVVQAPVDASKAQPADADAKATTTATATVAQQATPAADAQASAVSQQPAGDTKPVADKPVAAVPVAVGKSKQGQPDTAGQGQQNQQQQGTLPQPAADQARTVAQAYGRTTQHTTEVPTTAQSGTPAASPATPVAGGQPAAARAEVTAPTPVPLARAAETVEQVVRLASSRGVTHARIALTPESLGSIDVHLRHTADGVVARVVAHSHDAVQQLQQAAADLRQQLEGQGVNLLSLDIGHSSPDQGSAAQAQADLGDGNRGDGRGLGNGGDAAGEDADATVNSTLRLPDGVLVDVLA